MGERLRRVLIACALVVTGACCGSALSSSPTAGPPPGKAAPAGPLSFQKITLSRHFFSEGAGVGDFNRDGKLDVVAGQAWVEGPAFQKRHDFMTPFLADRANWSKSFHVFVHDFDSDGWDDILIIDMPGQPAFWYRNPQGKGDTHWERHRALDGVEHESPIWGDLTGDGKNELVCGAGGGDAAQNGGRLGYATPDPSDPTKTWTFHPITLPDARYWAWTHGLGIGDVNGDGRVDVLESSGWLEHPASLEGEPVWKKHPQNFGPIDRPPPGMLDGGGQMYAYDVDGDGDADVISSHNGHDYGLSWFESKPEGGELTFIRHEILPERPGKPGEVQFSELHAVELYDLDGDGLKDIITGKRWWAHGPTGYRGWGREPENDPEPGAPAVLYWFQLVRKDGVVQFIPHLIDDTSGIGTQVVVTDLDGDHRGDVVVVNKQGQFIFLQRPRARGATPTNPCSG